ncbi:AAA family ATPase, partial [Janthinobacterium sp.]|uniref:AAA family ATPase n=1 Tax=Janthinobacterium sp. TaxID=1871054 RepID=UPI0025C1E4EA
MHLIFLVPEGVEIRNSASRIAPGVDVRGEGGYVIVPPSPGYSLADPTDPAEMPRWLIRACTPPEREQRPVAPPQPPREHGGSRYGLAALADECNAIRRAPFGQQETTLNAGALKIGALVAGGEIEEGVALGELLAAGRSMGSESGREAWQPDEIENKVRRAFKDGHNRPRKAPERPEEHAPPDLPPDYWDALGLDPELFRGEEDAPEIVPVEEGIKSGQLLPFFTYADASARLDVDDFVEGLLTSRSMAVVYGESNSGKTFFVTDLALHIAASRPWRGREIDGGLVIYLALEGSLGIRNRITAWKESSGLADYDLPFIVVPVSVNLLDPNADAAAVIATVRAVAAQFNVPPRLIVIDTLSRAMAGGNENAPEDMTALIGTGDTIREQTGSCLLWIHHSGKDTARGARGHSSLRAATDTEIEITVDGQARMARVTKQRDLDGAGEFPFVLKVVELGTNRRGKAVTSCIVEDGAPSVPGGTRNVTGHAKRALEVLSDLINASGGTGYTGT